MPLTVLIDHLVELGFSKEEYLRLGLPDGRYILISDPAGVGVPTTEEDGLCAVLWSPSREVIDEVEICGGSFDHLLTRVQTWALGGR